jgi:hypothetical protein
MTAKIVPYKAEHLLALRLQDSQRYYREHITQEYASALEQVLSFSVVGDDGIVYACGGITELWENRAVLWSVMSERAGEVMVQIVRAVKRYLDIAPYRRIEADVDVDFEQGHRLLRMLGFQVECERMRAYRVDGGDSALYSKVK